MRGLAAQEEELAECLAEMEETEQGEGGGYNPYKVDLWLDLTENPWKLCEILIQQLRLGNFPRKSRLEIISQIQNGTTLFDQTKRASADADKDCHGSSVVCWE